MAKTHKDEMKEEMRELRERIAELEHTAGNIARNEYAYVSSAAREGAHHAMDSAREGAHHAKERAVDLEHKFEDKVKEKPIESVSIAFVVGVLVGVMMGRRGK